MDAIVAPTVSFVLAAILTYADLDRVFDAPPEMRTSDRCKLVGWWWGFVVANALLALILSVALDEFDTFREMKSWLKGLVVGAGYSALIRLKLTTFSLNGQEIPFGLETFYEGFKGLVHRRINHVLRRARAVEAEKLVQLKLADLRNKARTLVMSDALMSDEQQKQTLSWIEEVALADDIPEQDRRILIATFIVTGQTRR